MKARTSTSNGTSEKAALGNSSSLSTSQAPSTSAERGGNTKKNIKREFTVTLHGVSSSPPDLLSAIRSSGFFVLTLDCSPLPWNEVKLMDFTPAFDCPYIHTEAVGESSLLGYSPAPAPLLRSPFFKLVCELFKDTLRKPFLNINKPENFRLEPGCYKFDARLSLACQLMDTSYTLHEKVIHGFRLIVFNVPMVVDVKVTAGDDFFEQRKKFWADLVQLTDESYLFPEGVYYKSSGNSVSISLQANQLLILPAPCVFLPAVNEGDVYMMTSFIPRKLNSKVPLPQPQSLSLIYTSSAVQTRYPLRKKSFFDALAREDNDRDEDELYTELQKKVLAVEEATMGMDITEARQHVSWSLPTAKAVIHPAKENSPDDADQTLPAASPKKKVTRRPAMAANAANKSNTVEEDKILPSDSPMKKGSLAVKFPCKQKLEGDHNNSKKKSTKKRSESAHVQPQKKKRKKRLTGPRLVVESAADIQAKHKQTAAADDNEEVLTENPNIFVCSSDQEFARTCVRNS